MEYHFTLFKFVEPLEIDIPCHAFSYVGSVLFLITTIKSIYDLIVCEIIQRDVPLFKWTLRKLFHVLLPIPQAAFCFSCIVYNMYCIDLRQQLLANILLTSIGGYILALCFLVNALHWASLTTESENLKSRVFFIGGIVIFLLIPLVLEILIIINYSQQKSINKLYFVHFAEIIYNSIVNFFVLIVVFMSWFCLHQKLKQFLEIPEIVLLKKQLTLQMGLYLTFFFIRAVCLLVLGIFGRLYLKTPLMFRLVVFFLSAVAGDIPLAISMLYFLRPKKAAAAGGAAASGFNPGVNPGQQGFPEENADGSPAEFAADAAAQGGTSMYAGGGGGGKGRGRYQYGSLGMEDGSPGLNGQIDLNNSTDGAYPNMPYFHSQPMSGLDSTNSSYYVQGNGYV